MTRAFSTLISLVCLGLALSGCAALGVGVTAITTLKQGVDEYCQVPPNARAALRSKLGIRQLIRCEGDPETQPPQTGEPTAAIVGLRHVLS